MKPFGITIDLFAELVVTFSGYFFSLKCCCRCCLIERNLICVEISQYWFIISVSIFQQCCNILQNSQFSSHRINVSPVAHCSATTSWQMGCVKSFCLHWTKFFFYLRNFANFFCSLLHSCAHNFSLCLSELMFVYNYSACLFNFYVFFWQYFMLIWEPTSWLCKKTKSLCSNMGEWHAQLRS